MLDYLVDAIWFLVIAVGVPAAIVITSQDLHWSYTAAAIALYAGAIAALCVGATDE